MKNTFGTSVCITIFGESHGPAVGAVIDGLAPGIAVDTGFIEHQLTLRRPFGNISTARVENDRFEIISGVFNGKTTGTPISIVISNMNKESRDYSELRKLARPGHADLTAFEKYHGFEDYRGGGHFSGRVTAALTAAGAVAIAALQGKGIFIGTHIKSCGGIKDRNFNDICSDINELGRKLFAVLDDTAGEKMKAAIAEAAADGDSIGGILETAVTGVPEGIGEPWFDTVEGLLAHGLFSVPGIKGVQFGAGFDLADARGSTFNDPFRMEGSKTVTLGNNNGGVNGGICNGMPVIFRCAVKPTPSIYKEQDTVDFIEKKNAKITLKGRHDPAIIHRARVVVDSVTALVLCDLLAQRFGTDWLGGTV